MRIDLHSHSTASDGALTPADLVAAAGSAQLDVLGLTDHDTVQGWAAAAAALPAGLSLVRGAEISCTHGGISLHLLGYLFDPSHAPLSDALTALRDSRVGRAEAMVRSLQDAGVPVSWEQVRDRAGGAVGRPHIALALQEARVVSSIAEAFSPEWIGTGGRHWVGHQELDVRTAIGLVRDAGGVTVFAHPAAESRGAIVSEAAIAELAEAGLDGLEVDHPDHPQPTRDRLSDLAHELGLLPIGSSDFHGSHKDVQLGRHLTDPDVYDELVARASGVAVL